MKNKKGFSLVELMVVVAIIGIITAIAIPLYNRYNAKSAQEAALLEMRVIMNKYKVAYSSGENEFNFIQTNYKGQNILTTLSLKIGDIIGSNFTDSERNKFLSYYNSCFIQVDPKIESGEVKFRYEAIINEYTSDFNSPLCLSIFNFGVYVCIAYIMSSNI